MKLNLWTKIVVCICICNCAEGSLVTAVLEFCISDYIGQRSFVDCFCMGSLLYLTTVICRVLSAHLLCYHSPLTQLPTCTAEQGQKVTMMVARWNKDRIFHVTLPGKEDPVQCMCMLHVSPKEPEIFT